MNFIITYRGNKLDSVDSVVEMVRWSAKFSIEKILYLGIFAEYLFKTHPTLFELEIYRATITRIVFPSMSLILKPDSGDFHDFVIF